MKSDIIDKEVWEGLREFEKSEAMPGFFRNLLEAALTAANVQMEGLKKSVEDGEPKRVHYYSHTLKSSCASLGAMGLAEKYGQIEKASLEKPPVIRKDVLADSLPDFEIFLQEVRAEHDRLQKMTF